MNKKVIFLCAIFVLLAGWFKLKPDPLVVTPIPESTYQQEMSMNTSAIEAIKSTTPLPFVVVKNARVVRLLPDDHEGPLHQRWIMEIENGVTITVFHNVNIAERIPLAVGEMIDTVAGELEYGDRWKDPIMHWTHDDPQNKHKPGYVIFKGQTYGHATGP